MAHSQTSVAIQPKAVVPHPDATISRAMASVETASRWVSEALRDEAVWQTRIVTPDPVVLAEHQEGLIEFCQQLGLERAPDPAIDGIIITLCADRLSSDPEVLAAWGRALRHDLSAMQSELGVHVPVTLLVHDDTAGSDAGTSEHYISGASISDSSPAAPCGVKLAPERVWDLDQAAGVFDIAIQTIAESVYGTIAAGNQRSAQALDHPTDVAFLMRCRRWRVALQSVLREAFGGTDFDVADLRLQGAFFARGPFDADVLLRPMHHQNPATAWTIRAVRQDATARRRVTLVAIVCVVLIVAAAIQLFG
ncbi:MAG: type VI secretion protein IcmF/TssM N-terminal domain-containing protein [Planctomycetota bacterium]